VCDEMVNCPHCGMPLIRDGKYRHVCENEGCPVIFVESPYNPRRTKVAFESSATKDVVRKTQETMRITNLFLARAKQWRLRAFSLEPSNLLYT
jgi:hypothetical protein